ncbi:MAG TPA: hypothetical protein VMF58_04880 [Rhizomicrobium sp.]|nr:hypothetical protein [Rhizomicrobium sp.]
MMKPVHGVAAFMATLDDAHLEKIFADDVVIVENFAPYVFRGPDAVTRWRAGFRDHAATLADLRVEFGEPQDFSRDGDRAYFVLPTTWTGRTRGKAFEEHGGWAFVLVEDGSAWRVASYAWAVTAFRLVV